MKLSERIMNFSQIIEAQDNLNELTVPKWKAGMRPAQYVLAGMMEMAELVGDSGISWKWWKNNQNKEIDNWNVKIEVIDMLHFMVSAQILAVRKKLSDENAETRKKVTAQLEELGNTMFIGADILDMSGAENKGEFYLIQENGWINYELAVELVMNMATYTQENTFTYLDVFRLSFANIIQMVSSVGLTSLEISAIYTAKMTLNQIRQSNGYKDGTYVKVEDGVEDNQKLKSLVEDFIADETVSLNKLAKNVRNRFFHSKV